MTALDAAARWLGFGAVFLAVGASLVHWLLRRQLDPGLADAFGRGAGRLGWAAATAALVATVVVGYAQVQAFRDPGQPFFDAAVPVITGTAWGAGWLLQIVTAAAALVAFTLVLLASPRWWPLATLAGLAMIAAAPLTGHATENPWGPRIGVVLHAFHFLGGAIWLGTLGVLIPTLYRGTRALAAEARERVVADVIRAYSPLALGGAGLAIGIGLLLGYTYVGTPAALVGSWYGRALVLKVLVLGGVAALGAYNWRRVRPALGAAPGAARLARSAGIELLLGVLLLAVTAVLAGLAAPTLQ